MGCPSISHSQENTRTAGFICDYRRLNSVTDPYHQPRVEVVIEKMAPTTVFTILDLARGFYQVPIDMEDKDKTAIITPFGKFRFKVKLWNAPAVLQRMMDRFTLVYIVTVYSTTWEEHKQRVLKVFEF